MFKHIFPVTTAPILETIICTYNTLSISEVCWETISDDHLSVLAVINKQSAVTVKMSLSTFQDT